MCPAVPGRATRGLVWAFAVSALTLAARNAPTRPAAMWTRLDLVENTAEGPAFDRCEIEDTLEKGQSARWRVFYGEARADAGNGWSAIRSSSGCARAGAEPAAATWTLRGSPYFLVDVTVGQGGVSGREVVMEAAFTVQRLTGFAPDGGAPVYESSTEKRTVWVPEGGSAIVPILVASGRETDEFRVRELLMKLRARAAGSKPPAAYGELAVAADVPRAEIFLDGGSVGRTSSDGPVVLAAVRAGDREVIVRDASGREARTVARVQKGRRAGVTLTLMKGPVASADGLRPLGRNPQGDEEFWRDKDGAIVVRIPGGEFQMGSPEGEGEPSERPRHSVRVSDFLMDKTEVTWGQYKRFVAASGHPPPKSPVWGMPEAFPASSITWDEAGAFCAWAGGRLPTEPEWERAARGDDARQYPWGNTFDPWRCNTRDGGPHAPAPAGAYADCVGPYGVLDLAGGVQEWCSDWYQDTYDAKGTTGARRVSRGGEWMNSAVAVRAASRLGIDPTWPGPMLGFRCAQDDREAGGE